MLLIVFCCFYLFGYLIWSRRNKNLPPELSGKIPLIGHAHLFIRDSIGACDLIKEISRESLNHGGIVTFSLGPRTVYAITDPDDCLKVSNECLEKDFIYDFAKSWLGEGILTANVPIWKGHRKILNSAFSQNILEGFVGVFNVQGKRLVERIGDKVGKGPFDHGPFLSLNNLETICKSALGVDAVEHKALVTEYIHSLEKMLNILLERFQKIWMHSPIIYRWTKLKKEEDAALEVLHRLSNEVLHKRKTLLKDKTHLNTSSEKFKPFIDLILEMATEEGIYTDKQIRDEVDTLIFGGHDTVAVALIFVFVLIGSYKHVQDKLYEELQEIIGPTERDITKSDLSKLVYMNAVLKETLRLYPVGPVIARYVTNDIQLKNYTIPTGSSCFLFLWGLHRHPTWGPDADQFKPERWLNPSLLPENPNAFGAFSVGRRACIGRLYAMMSMKITLAHVLRRYRVSANSDQMILKMETFLKPVSGHHISLEERTL